MPCQMFCRQFEISHETEVCFCGEAAVCLARYINRWVHVLTDHLSTFPSTQPDGMQGKQLHSFGHVNAFCHFLSHFQIHEVLERN
jgi:hypothetical protein